MAAAAADAPSSPELDKTQNSIMKNLSSIVGINSWNSTTPVCNWTGVNCSRSGSGFSMVVTNITLSNYDMYNSSIIAYICNIDTLQSLDLSRNSFTDLGDLFSNTSCRMKEGLQSLNLSSNRLSQPLSNLPRFPQLEVLDLSINHFTGGNLNTYLSSFTNLRSLNLSFNHLNGDVPTSMVSSLAELVLSDKFMNLSKLEILLLSDNRLIGEIPDSLSNVTTLFRFAANLNNFTGQIPSNIANYVRMLDLSYNYLSGKIAPDFLSHPGLQTVDLTGNMLEGAIPRKLSQSLYRLRLGENRLSGNISDSICDGKGLTYLELDNNQLTGNIPSELGKCKNLSLLNLASNNLQGTVPDAISSLDKLNVEISTVGNPGLTNGTGNNNDTPITDEGLPAVESVPQIMNGCLITMNSIHTSAIEFMKAMEAVSNHQNIFLKTRFCTYYKAVMPNGTTYSVKKLNSSDKIFQIGNQEKFAREIEPVLLLDLSTRTIHLKSKNEPQIGDIELYKIIDPSRSTGSFSTIAGTVGYIPPEYAYTMRLTMAGNVYSFGVILLELLTGKPSVTDGIGLAKWALSLSARPAQREQILDTRISGASIAVHSQMLSVLNIALACVAFSPDARPKMRNVLRMLFNAK
nr:unnamed protein product [Digitaria exilis]